MKALNASRTKWFVIGAILLCAILAPHRCLAGISIGEIYGPLSLDSSWPPQGEGSPCWNPDGTMIAFRWGDGYTAWDPSLGGYPNPKGSYIVIMTADGQAIRGTDNPLVNDPYWDNGQPDWSPDGNWIVYVKSRVGPAQILKVPSTGGDAVPITQIDGNWHPNGPKWSPDGTKIAYRGGDYWTIPDKRPYHIWLTDTDGSTHEDLTPSITGYGVHYLSWSPDGTQIVFAQEGEPGLLVLDVATKEITTLPGFPLGLITNTPVWVSQNLILFVAGEDIYCYQIDTQTTKQLTYGPGDSLGDWHPTAGLVFSSSRGCTVRWDSNIYTAAPAPDFAISDIKPIQVVWNSDINGDDVNDLVAGKDTAVLVYMGMEGCGGLNKEELLNIRLSFDGKDYPESKTIAELEENNRIEFYPASPATTGDQIITAEIHPEYEFEEPDETNNEKSVKITVKETNGLYIVYFPVDGVDPDGPAGPEPGVPGRGYGELNMSYYSSTVIRSGKFISAVYPVAEGNFTNLPEYKKYYGWPVTLFIQGMRRDVNLIWKWAELSTGTLADRSVGVVPNNYFNYHGRGDLDGVTFPGTPGALVEVDTGTMAAHEIGHTFGLRQTWDVEDPNEEYQTNPPKGNAANGFWVSRKKEISDGICFMGKPGARPWICDEDYIDLFQEFRVDKTDPPAVLLLSGIISKDGTTQLGSLYMVENGIIDDVMPGDYSIEILDAHGQILTNIPFHTGFYAYLDPIGVVETDFAGFAFVIPYPENTSEIKVKHNGQTLTKIRPDRRLLHDAVDYIPKYGFIKNADQRRKALHNKIDEFETKIENNEIQDARNKLEHDIKDKFEKWLVDGYQKENPGQLSKDEVISLVDNILERFDILWNISAEGGEIDEPESDISESDIEDGHPGIDILDSELLAFWDYLEGDDHLDPDSHSTDSGDDSAKPEDVEEDVEEEPPITDDDDNKVDAVEDEAIAIEEAAAFTLFEAAEAINELSPENFSNEDVAIELANEIDIVLAMIDDELYTEALATLENDILERTNGCAEVGEPDENDWIRTYEGQGLVYPLIVEAIELLEILI